jgi:hypothetical protein
MKYFLPVILGLIMLSSAVGFARTNPTIRMNRIRASAQTYYTNFKQVDEKPTCVQFVCTEHPYYCSNPYYVADVVGVCNGTR